MEAAGGQILFWNGVRVMGVLAVSRAIGDHCLRPFVIAEPEVRTRRVLSLLVLQHCASMTMRADVERELLPCLQICISLVLYEHCCRSVSGCVHDAMLGGSNLWVGLLTCRMRAPRR